MPFEAAPLSKLDERVKCGWLVTFRRSTGTDSGFFGFLVDLAAEDAGITQVDFKFARAGKSTLIKLLCRFYDPDEGSVLLEGTDLRELSIEHLRNQLTVLFQEPVHFNSTVAENIALGDPAKRVNTWDFPLTPQPLSRVGERGADDSFFLFPSPAEGEG